MSLAVLVRQMPGSAKDVIFITLEDETLIANLIVWRSVFDANRRTILGSSMLGCRGRVQRQGNVIHLVVEHLGTWATISGQFQGWMSLVRLVTGRDGAKQQMTPDSRTARQASMRRATCTSPPCISIR